MMYSNVYGKVVKEKFRNDTVLEIIFAQYSQATWEEEECNMSNLGNYNAEREIFEEHDKRNHLHWKKVNRIDMWNVSNMNHAKLNTKKEMTITK